MNDVNEKIFEFDDFRLDLGDQKLTRHGDQITLTPKVFELLKLLVENHGRLMTKEELIEKLWQDSFVEEANLNVNISTLRRALGEKPNEHRYIETVPRRGYRFVAKVTEIREEKEDRELAEPSVSDVSTISFETRSKQCPKCHKLYYDQTLNYCLDDGAELVDPEALGKRTLGRSRRTRIVRLGLLFAGLILFVFIASSFWRSSVTNSTADISQLRVIAVLPFRPLVSEQSDQALQMGMADALITKLSSLEQVTVRPTSAIEKYSESNVDPIVAGRELQVEAILNGKIQRADNKIRVTVQLLRVSDGATLWGGSFDDFFTNIFAVQDSISEKLMASLRIKLSGNDQKEIAKRYTENTEAYDLFLQGIAAGRNGTPDAVLNSLDLFRRAIDKDPNYVLAYAAAARAYVRLATYNIEVKRNAELAKAMAAKAESLDADVADVNSALGAIAYEIDLNLTEAEKYFSRAQQISPGSAGPIAQRAQILSDLGRGDEALSTIERARLIDPISSGVNVTYMEVLVNSGRADQAIIEGQKLTAENPRSVQYRRYLGRAYAAKGMYQEAIEQYLTDVDFGGMKKAPALLGFAYAKAGKTEEARKILRDRIEHAGEPTNPYYGVALIYAGLGENDKAFEWLEKSYIEREPAIFSIKSSPEWAGIHSDPRYLDLARRLGLEQ